MADGHFKKHLDLLHNKFTSVIFQIKEQKNSNEILSHENNEIKTQIDSVIAQHNSEIVEATHLIQELDAKFLNEKSVYENLVQQTIEYNKFLSDKDCQISELTEKLQEILYLLKLQKEEASEKEREINSKLLQIDACQEHLLQEDKALLVYHNKINQLAENIRKIDSDIIIVESDIQEKENSLANYFTTKIRFEENSKNNIKDLRDKMQNISTFSDKMKQIEKLLQKKEEELQSKYKRYESLQLRNNLLIKKLQKLNNERETYNEFLHQNSIVRFNISELKKVITSNHMMPYSMIPQPYPKESNTGRRLENKDNIKILECLDKLAKSASTEGMSKLEEQRIKLEILEKKRQEQESLLFQFKQLHNQEEFPEIDDQTDSENLKQNYNEFLMLCKQSNELTEHYELSKGSNLV